MTLVVREDLTLRTALSKSEVISRHFCGVFGYYSRTMPRPWTPVPDMVFGSALDAAIEQLLKAERDGKPWAEARCIEAASEVAERDGIEVDLDEIRDAVGGFAKDILPLFDWTACALQPSLSAEIEGRPVNGHPDIILADTTILDVKASNSKSGKTVEDIWAKPEMPIYTALHEAVTGFLPKRLGYLVWRRALATPKWQVPVPILDADADLAAEGRMELGRQANLRRQYAALHNADVDPARYLEGPKFASKCLDCAYVDVCSLGQRRLRRLTGEGA